MASTSHNTSLLTALNCDGHVHLVIGTNPLAAARCAQSLNAGASPVVLSTGTDNVHYGLQKLVDAGSVKWHREEFRDEHLFTFGRVEVGHVVDAVFVTTGAGDPISARISNLCRRNRIPVNVVDAPRLCTFTLLSTHTDGPLQVGVTTNGRGCKLASRIRREIAACLPPNLGLACARLGEIRRRIHEEDQLSMAPDDIDDSFDQTASFNKLVTEKDLEDVKNRRMRWLSQVCEYWPLKKLASVSDEDIKSVLSSYRATLPSPLDGAPSRSDALRKSGRVILAGSGPGHPDLLTRATYRAIQTADLILADKLVPSSILDLIPRRTPVQIARKFPGNADQAQEELLEAALAGVMAEKTVLRLKQGDPFIYGRGGEEVAYFRSRGLGDKITILPGITSALSAPLFASIPPTQRDVADQVLICTGTGKKGKPPSPPGYVQTRTVVFLMALHRIASLVQELTCHTEEEKEREGSDHRESGDTEENRGLVAQRNLRRLWPQDTPCAVVERASCPDQRVIRTTLDFVVAAIEQEGSRPPGLLIVGAACEVLYTREKGRSWIVEDAFKGLEVDDWVSMTQSSSA